MNVLTLNLWGVPGTRARRARFAAARAALSESVAAGAVDVVLLQELWMAPDRGLFDGCGLGHEADADRIWSRPQNWLTAPFGIAHDSGLKILSRYPVTEVRRRLYSLRGRIDRLFKDAEVSARKSALAARLETPHLGPVWVVDTHLIANHPDEPYVARRASQLRELAAFLAELPAGEPIVFGGDLNVGPDVGTGTASPGYVPELWDELFPRLFAGYREAEEIATAVTFRGGGPYNPCPADESLDHIFVGPGLLAREGRIVLSEAAVDLGAGERGPISDHYGVLVQVARA
ncbi:MAG: endonuclease/exonuclease/phosphatase family protein [Alphaproteobacteria bacterium]|nr:endonuclease/exonuclease/phosphatase family protein [Alphaproteobacteria bacterium]